MNIYKVRIEGGECFSGDHVLGEDVAEALRNWEAWAYEKHGTSMPEVRSVSFEAKLVTEPKEKA